MSLLTANIFPSNQKCQFQRHIFSLQQQYVRWIHCVLESVNYSGYPTKTRICSTNKGSWNFKCTSWLEYIDNIGFMTSIYSPLKLVLATRNTHKAAELKLLLAYASIDVMDLSAFPGAPLVNESASSLEENAALKATSAYKCTGLWAIGDDTGLCIDALNGQPGVRSARFAGTDTDDKANRTMVLQMLENETNRSAQFITILALAYSGGLKHFRGCLHGHIATSEMSPQGFGYESIFVPEGSNISLAQLSREEKNEISHRGRCAAKLLEFLNEIQTQ